MPSGPRSAFFLGLVALLSLSLSCGGDAAPSPTLAVLGARIWTGNPEAPWAEALLVENDRIVAVGTTSLRLLETAAEGGRIAPFRGATDIFITPGYRFRAVDLLMTNFHLPRSTLFMLVSAFSGLDTMQAAYAHALGQGYRFYSYGDACLLFPSA